MSESIWNMIFVNYISLSETVANPGLFTSENKNALESYWFKLLESIREKLKMEPSVISAVCSDILTLEIEPLVMCIDTRDKPGNKFSYLKRI